ncbi:uncharacterized protein VTP21DRAFT_1715 [Calcarisporiella thermophila]|uniref:uncharacterized protein n=1 Tax=Calcarisporiella thermophila TaxID=911321 RepID=UPI003743BCE0
MPPKRRTRKIRDDSSEEEVDERAKIKKRDTSPEPALNESHKEENHPGETQDKQEQKEVHHDESLTKPADTPTQDGQSTSETNGNLNRASSSISEPQKEEARKPRLVITKMVLINFKSYAGKQEIGPFHKSFSSVVGPNGSGKSNVIDALLFVFGYRASKMRQGKLSELIHSSAKHKNLDMCGVEVHFQEIYDLPGPDAYEVVPDSQLIICRQAYRNNTSKYFINNMNSNFTTVTNLLRERGIDLDHKRFLILQGEVESISQMKPKARDEHDEGLLEYLEDIIGTSKYKQPIEEASKSLETLNDERSERLNRVIFVEKEKLSLEAKKSEAEAYLRTENELIRKKSMLYQLHIYECHNNIDISKKTVDELKLKLEQETGKQSHVKDELNEMEEKYNNIVNEYENLGKETNEIIKELSKFERLDVQLQEKRKHLKAKQKKLEKSLQSDKHQRSENQSWIKNYESELVKQRGRVVELEAALEKEERELELIRDSLKEKTAEFSAQIEEKQRELAPWKEKLNSKQSQIDVAQSELDILKEKALSGQKAVESAEKEIVEIRDEREAKGLEIVEAKKNIEAKRKEIKHLEKVLKQMQQQDAELRTTVYTARQKAEDAKASLQNSRSRGAVLQNLLRLRDSGRIKGIYGRLGELGVIDDKYDVAISTACPALDNIVVESVEAGQACIEYLRKNNLGRAVFILLNQLPKQDLSKIPTPDNVPRLFDLVTPKEPKFAPAFYSVLKNTLVARDLKHANQIAFGNKQRWRVVTLDGQLIDKSGTMSGGGTRVMRGSMSSKFVETEATEEVISQLEKEREARENEWTTFQRNQRQYESQLEALASEIPQLETNLSKLEMDFKACEEKLEDAHKRAKDLKQQNKPDEGDKMRVKHLEREIEKLKQELAKLRVTPLQIEEQIRQLQDKILQIGGVRLRSQQATVDAVREQIETVSGNITKTQVAKSKAEKDLAKAEANVLKVEKELEEMEVQATELDKDIEEKSKAANRVREQVEQSKELMEEKKEVLEELKKELDERTEIINQIRTAEVEIKNELEDHERNLAENQRKAAHWKELWSKLSLQSIGDTDSTELELHEFTPDELRDMEGNKQALKGEIAMLEAKIQNAKPNLSVLEEYRRREEEYQQRAQDLEAITMQRDSAKRIYDEYRKRRLDEFMQGFTIISQKLKEMYQLITLGGNAELELVDSLDPFSEGIIFSVMPPKKSWKQISNLSGGEKTLSSLALVFALHHFKPTPLYVMDEIDAALDFRNVSIVANYIKERTRNAQFIIISLRNNMFELADRLVGIYKTDGCTKSVAINPSRITIPTVES